MKSAAIICSLLFAANIAAQTNIAFKHLNTSNGLSYVGVNDMCVDAKGNLWIATGNGLNMFNGKTTEKYFASDYPQLQSSVVSQVKCDASNRVWVLTPGGNVSMLDENRRFHKIAIYDSNRFVRTTRLLLTKNGTISLQVGKGNYTFNNIPISYNDSIGVNKFQYLPIKGLQQLKLKGRNSIFNYDENHYLLVNPAAVVKVESETNTVLKKFSMSNCRPLMKWEKTGLLYFDLVTKELKNVDLETGEISYPLKDKKDQYGNPVSGNFLNAKSLSENRCILSTESSGLYIYDRTSGKIFNYHHSFSEPTSIASNNINVIAPGKEGWVFLSCVPTGISYFNMNELVNNQHLFADNDGRGYDGYIAGIATRDNNTYYIGGYGTMFEWNRSTNSSRFIDYVGRDGKSILDQQEITSLTIDDSGNIWATLLNNGVAAFDKNRKLLKHFKNEKGNKQSLKLVRTGRIVFGPDGYVWTCGRNGISRINPKTFEIDNLENTPLKIFDSVHTVPFYFIDKENMMIGTSNKGIFHYNIRTQELKEQMGFAKYEKGQGLYDLNVDSAGTVYVGHSKGLRLFYKDGRDKLISKKDGLLIDRAEGLLLDKHNRMWIGNDIGLACYNPADSSLRVFDERFGLSVYGFRVGSYFQTPNGEFILGTPNGIQYFHPDSLYNTKPALNVHVSKIETRSTTSQITGTTSFKLPARDNQVTFYFSSVEYRPNMRTYYEYKLVDLDKEWIRVADQNSIRYNFLPPGNYVFKIRVSNDGKTWQEGSNEVTITIASFFYQTWWFKSLALMLAMTLFWYVLRHYQKKQHKQEEQLETQLVINYFASQINIQQHTDDLLWDVAKNCISKLNFEDCVIYLLDTDRNMLVQKAAWGPKMERDFTIYQPIEIPVGKGIVGTVAKTGKAELISNTELDERYIADDARRFSEITVPLIIDNKVIGVIDSEHSRKNFFTQRHLTILSTIAVLCANQIQRSRAEEEKQKATIEVLENKQKVTESRLQSLRLQMNPHFLFNALNSIQQMILANEEMVATRYLSRFSKLLRTILVHSDKEMVSLKEELEILNLYVELEAIRFKDSFNYSIECDEEIDKDEVKVPTLLIQPFVENAIWHGLMHKEGGRELKIRFVEKDDRLHCIVEDNGIGREKARETKISSGQRKNHTSKGIAVSLERLKTLHGSNGHTGSLTIIDLKNNEGQATGTRVEIDFPIQN